MTKIVLKHSSGGFKTPDPSLFAPFFPVILDGHALASVEGQISVKLYVSAHSLHICSLHFAVLEVGKY